MLPVPDFFEQDFSKPCMRDGILDAIICDPPYGLRARVNRMTEFEDNQDQKDIKILKLTKFEETN